MPDIGVQKDGLKNPFDQVKMQRKNFKDTLNRIAGKETGTRFVDRKNHNTLGKDGFLKILSYQLANQDPLKPMDQKRFAADLAQFSQLEQLANINTKMSKSEKNVPAQNKFYGASFIGKKVLTKGTSIDFEEGKNAILPFYLDQDAQKAIVRIYDRSKNLVRELNFDNLSGGSQAVTWDGLRSDSVQADKGLYYFDVIAFDKEYNRFRGKTQTEGIVTGVNFDNGEVILLVDGTKRVFLRDVKQFQVNDLQSKENIMASVGKEGEEDYNKARE